MKRTSPLILVLLLGFTISGQAADPDSAHNSQNSLDWPGTYEGPLPAEEGGRRDVRLVLHSDGRFELSDPAEPSSETVAKGKFSWDAVGRSIQLEESAGTPSKFYVGEDFLTPELAKEPSDDVFILKKVPEVAATRDPAIEGIRWKLTELNGRAVDVEKANGQIAYFALDPAEERMSGSGGCNRIGGGYVIESGNRIRFSQIFSTMMACPDLETEAAFIKVLETADNYALGDGGLSLNRARMAPLARFVPIEAEK